MGDMTRHEFLAELHRRLQPKTYLEVGVQSGASLVLAEAADLAIGIDPIGAREFLPANARNNQRIGAGTADQFFSQADRNVSLLPDRELQVDFAFIDGMHLFEYALRDFMNIERYCRGGSVVVFDDVLPRNQHEARRLEPGTPILGDWTGDVWKVAPVLEAHHTSPHLYLRLVDTQPTGVFVVTGFPNAHHPWTIDDNVVEQWSTDMPVPDDVLNRTKAWTPDRALDQIEEEIKTWRS